MIGTKLAHYEITSHLGSGGMGDVYRATDAKLGRSVAIKLLPEAFTHDAERTARFEREARVLAALNHVNIAAIYGVEESGDRKFLVMELVRGETLADRIQRGPIVMEETLSIAAQIAEALGAAHEKGVVHRDLKPANVMITSEGKVKVLDFGLAKGLEADRGAAVLSQSPTLSAAVTEGGVILGSAAYMAPEQARGKPVDKRADIWAFGVVLYEMLAGHRLFKGDDVSETLASVIKDQPDFDRIPLKVRRLIRRCLEKDTAKRLRDIGDVWELLEETTPVDPVVVRERSSLPWVIVAIVVAAAGITLWTLRPIPTVLPDRIQLELTLSIRNQMEISPDGRLFAFVGRGSNNLLQALWIRRLDSGTPQMLSGTDGMNGSPFWSYDSRFIAFFQGSRFRKIDVTSGVISTIAEKIVGSCGCGSWNKDGVVLVGGGSGVQRVSLADGTVTPLTKPDPSKDLDHIFARLLPDGRHFLYVRQASNRVEAVLMVGLLEATPAEQPSQPLTTTQAGASEDRIYFIPAGKDSPARVLFRRNDTVLAQALDMGTRTLVGEPVPLSEGNVNFFTASPGVLAYTSAERATSQLILYDRGGKPLAELGTPMRQYNLRVSPDGTRVAVERQTPFIRNVWGLELNREVVTKLTSDVHGGSAAVWSPDGSQLIFSSRSNGGLDIFRRASNGAGEEQFLLKGFAYPQDWSDNGFVLYTLTQATPIAVKTGPDLWLLPMKGGALGMPSPYIATPAAEFQGQFSRDGRWVAYVSNETGRNQIYVSSFPDAAKTKIAISTNGGNQPRWSRDGKELFYVSDDDSVMAVPFSTAGGVFSPENPKALFKAPVYRSAGTDMWSTGWDTVPGSRFLINVTATPNDLPPISVVLNWQSGLK